MFLPPSLTNSTHVTHYGDMVPDTLDIFPTKGLPLSFEHHVVPDLSPDQKPVLATLKLVPVTSMLQLLRSKRTGEPTTKCCWFS